MQRGEYSPFECDNCGVKVFIGAKGPLEVKHCPSCGSEAIRLETDKTPEERRRAVEEAARKGAKFTEGG